MSMVIRYLENSTGNILVAVLLVLAVVIGLLADFTYDVYVTTHSIAYTRQLQILTPIARSGLVLSARLLSETGDIYSLSPTGEISTPIQKVTEHFDGNLIMTAYDENGRFNINSLVYQNGQYNPATYEAFKRLLSHLGLETKIADCIIDWMDRDKEERISGAEVDAKNTYLDAVEEIYQISCLKSSDIELMKNYITVYGYDRRDSSVVNINSASIPVIMTIDERITKELAQRIVDYRSLEPFKNTTDILKVSGFEGALGQSMLGKIAVKVKNLRIISSAEKNGVKRIIEAVVELVGKGQMVKYWREM
ncbi:MAG: general secretion pathway protein GspK [Thermodesulfovibrionales bacterium]|nr:general secretion pathway protein GspK [Thermodesulfovibrionales bacterium]